MSGISYPHWKGGRDGVSGLNQQRARTLLRELDQSLKATGLFSGTRSMRYADGAYITVTITGNAATIRVDQERQQRKTPRDYPDPTGFVVTARKADLLSGILPLFPQQILRPGDVDWTVLTYDDSYTTGRSDGTYKGEFNDGVKYAGNIDWLNADGVRLCWYGPSRRYWYDPWRRPDAQYGQWVFLNGQILLDTQAHGAAAQKYVLGAALVGDKLYVMQATINDFGTDYASMYPTPRDHSWVSPPYPDGDTVLRLCRYTVLEDTSVGVKAQDRYSIVPDSYESLWNDTRRGYVNPWFFNMDATVCETFAMPDELRHIRGNNLLSASSGQTTLISPSLTSDHTTLERDAVDDTISVTTSALSLVGEFSGSQVDSTSEVAAEYLPDGTRRALSIRHLEQVSPAFPGAYELVTLKSGDTPAVVISEQIDRFVPDPDEVDYRASALLYADVRQGVIATLNWDFSETVPNNFTRTVRVYIDGVLTYSENISTDTLVSSTPDGALQVSHRGRGLCRGHGVWLSGRPTDADNATVSPMYMFSGIEIFANTATVEGQRVLRDSWTLPVTGLLPYMFPDSELEGRMVYPAIYNVVIGTSAARTGMIGIGTADAVIKGSTPFLPANSAFAAADSLGRRIYQSVAIDADGRLLASLTAPMAAHRTSTTTVGLGDHPDNDFYRTLVSVAFSSDDSLATLTGVAGTTGTLTYGVPVPNLYDARYTPIWQLGIWPVVGPRPTEE